MCSVKCEHCEVTHLTREGLEQHMKQEHDSTRQMSVKQSPPSKKQKDTPEKLLDEKDEIISQLRKKVTDLETKLKEKDKPKLVSVEVATDTEFKTVTKGPRRMENRQETQQYAVDCPVLVWPCQKSFLKCYIPLVGCSDNCTYLW